MSKARDRDLERWEQGGLSTSELVALHGSDGVAGLIVLHRRMSALGTAPVGDLETVWGVIRERLPALAGLRRRAPLRRRLTRPLAIAAAVVLIAGTAYAGSPDAVQRYLTSVWHTVRSMLDVDVAGNAPADVDRPPQDGGQDGRPAGDVDDAELEDPDENDANDDGDQPVETSEGDGGADGDEAEDGDENGSDDDGDGTGGDEGDEPVDDAEGDEPDEPEDDGEPEDDDEEPEEDDEPEDGDEEPEDGDEDD